MNEIYNHERKSELFVRGIDYIDVAVSGVMLFKNQICMLKRKTPPEINSWCLPGGKVNHDETVQEAIKREFQEEINADTKNFKIIDILGVSNYIIPEKKYHCNTTIFLVKCTGNFLNNESKKHSKIGFFDFNALPGHIAASSRDALMYYFKYLNERTNINETRN